MYKLAGIHALIQARGGVGEWAVKGGDRDANPSK